MSRKRKTRSTGSAVKPPTIDLEATELPQGEEAATEASAKIGEEVAPDTSSAGEAVEELAAGEGAEHKQGEAPDEAAGEEPGPSDEHWTEDVNTEATPAAKQEGGRRWQVAVVIAVIAAGVGALLYREYGAQIFPSSATAAAMERLEARMARLEKAQGAAAGDVRAASDEAKAASEGLIKVSARLDELNASFDDLKARAGASETTAADLKARFDTLTETARQSASEIANLQSALGAAAKPGDASQQSGAAAAVQIAALASTIDNLKERVKTLEEDFAGARQEVSSLSARLEEIAKRPGAPEAGGKSAQLAAAYAAMEKRISEGKPFAAELDKLKTLDPNLPGLAELAGIAGEGVLSEGDLASGLDQALNEVVGTVGAKSSASEEGWLAALKRRMFGVIKIRKVGEPDWQAAGALAKQALARGDLDGAIAALGPENSKTPQPIAKWLAAADARRQVLERLSDLSAAVFQSVKRNAS